MFKNYYDYCKKTNKSYIYQRYKHSMFINKLKINYRKLKSYLNNEKYEPYPNPRKNEN